MKIQNAMNEMLTLQCQLNDATNGAQWREGMTAQGREIDWRRCIYMETAELIDSYPWKHWKSIDAATDIENVKVELVDIWHFLLSLALEHMSQSEACGLLMQTIDVKVETQDSVMTQVAVHENMMRISMERDAVDAQYLTRLAQAFFASCQLAALSFESLYQIYMAKNVLNQFRQDHGYKDGSYQKVWQGKEDNVVMFEIIATMSEFSGKHLYEALSQRYSTLSD